MKAIYYNLKTIKQMYCIHVGKFYQVRLPDDQILKFTVSSGILS